jgi:hypothetical protein
MRIARILLPLSLLVLGCAGSDEPPHEGFGLLHVDEVVALRRDGGATLLDANGTKFRDEHGVIPGAVLLSKHDAYDVATELPPQKNARLVFYCADSH